MSTCSCIITWPLRTCECLSSRGAANLATDDGELWVCGNCLLPSFGWLRGLDDSMLQYFRGGPLDGLAYSVNEITSSRVEVPVIEYAWTHDRILSTLDGEEAWVWVWKSVLQNYLPPIDFAFLSRSATVAKVQDVWVKADAAYTQLVAMTAQVEYSEVQYATLRGRLNTFSEILASFMAPHLSTAKEVGAELKLRHEANQSGTVHETPGLKVTGCSAYEARIAEANGRSPAPVDAGTVAVPAPTPKRVSINVDAETQAAIKGLEGLAEPHEIAQIYGVQTDVVKAILAKSG